MIKTVEINYRGIFQKNLAKKIGSDIVIIASRMGRVGMSNGRYSDSPERNGIPCKYFAFVTHDLEEEELEAEAGAKLDIDTADVSVVLDDTMCKGVEPWGWHGIRPINEKLVQGGALVVISKRDHPDLLRFIGAKPFEWRLGIIEGDASLAGLWVNKDDFTHERSLGAIAGVDPDVIGIEAVEAYIPRIPAARRPRARPTTKSGPKPGPSRRTRESTGNIPSRCSRSGASSAKAWPFPRSSGSSSLAPGDNRAIHSSNVERQRRSARSCVSICVPTARCAGWNVRTNASTRRPTDSTTLLTNTASAAASARKSAP